MPFRRRRHPILGLIEDRPLVLAFALVLGVGLLAGGAWWWADGRTGRSTDDPVLMELFASGKALESEFLAIAATRDPDAGDIALLGKAVENQRNWMRATGDNDPEQLARLRQMESTFEAARSRMLATSSREAEEAARAELDAGQDVAALAYMETALESQRELNRGHPRAEHRDLPRESRLAQEVEVLRVAPLVETLNAALARAKTAAEAGRREESIEAWHAAREAQARINREFPRVRHADLGSLDRIDMEIDTLTSEAGATAIGNLQKQATEAAARGRMADAATLFGEAIALQREINTASPRSRFVSIERLEKLEIERQTALGSALAARIARVDQEVTALLAAGNVGGAQPKIAEGGAAMDELASKFPRSRQADPGLRLKFNYLTTVRESLEAIVTQVRTGVAPIPGRDGVVMLRTEVPQELYERVMGSNPSRAPGLAQPVDSVSWNDAADFCRRLSWVVGGVVRLPTEDEFRAAIGVSEESAPAGLVWHPPISELKPRPVTDGPANARGFSDLLGNVGEWLDAAGATSGDSAPVAGGSFTDVPDPGRALPIEIRARIDRNRATGFRFVIEAR